MQAEWWHWAVSGIALLLAELAVPVRVLVWFGLSALAVALATALLPELGLETQLAAWLSLAFLLVIVWFRILRRTSSI